MEYLSAVGVIEPREDKQFDQMYQRQVEAVRPSYRKAFRGYIKFCLDVRMLSRVTVLNEGVQIRDFLVWFEDVSGGQHLGAVHTGIVREYLTSRLMGTARNQCTLSTRRFGIFSDGPGCSGLCLPIPCWAPR